MPVSQESHSASSHLMLALDPGKTTGFCLGWYSDGKLCLAVDQAELSLFNIAAGITKLVGWNTPTTAVHVIYEDFTYRNNPRMGLDLTPVKIIGVIELHQEYYESMASFAKQSAAAGKSFYVDDMLKELGIYRVGRQHGRDATRHLMHWINFGAGGRYEELRTAQVKMIKLDQFYDDFLDGGRLFP